MTSNISTWVYLCVSLDSNDDMMMHLTKNDNSSAPAETRTDINRSVESMDCTLEMQYVAMTPGIGKSTQQSRVLLTINTCLESGFWAQVRNSSTLPDTTVELARQYNCERVTLGQSFERCSHGSLSSSTPRGCSDVWNVLYQFCRPAESGVGDLRFSSWQKICRTRNFYDGTSMNIVQYATEFGRFGNRQAGWKSGPWYIVRGDNMTGDRVKTFDRGVCMHCWLLVLCMYAPRYTCKKLEKATRYCTPEKRQSSQQNLCIPTVA